MKKIDITKFVRDVVKNGANMPLNEPCFSIIKEQNPEAFGHLKDTPQGAGLYYTFLYQVVKQLQPKLILELGNREGSSTISIVCALTDSQEFYTVDIKKDLRFVSSDILGQENVHTVFGSSTDPQIVDSVPNDIDFLFIDTLHKYEHLSKEWSLYSKKLSDGAIVACDDINWPGMARFINDIKHFDHVNDTRLHGSGFLVFQFQKEQA